MKTEFDLCRWISAHQKLLSQKPKYNKSTAAQY